MDPGSGDRIRRVTGASREPRCAMARARATQGVDLVLASLLVLLMLRALPVAAGDLPGWSRIDFEAHKFLLSATASVRLRHADRAELLEVPGYEVRVAPPGSLLRMEAASSFLMSESRTLLWLDGDTVQLLQKERIDERGYGRYKSSRVLRDGIYRWQRRAEADDANAEPASWRIKREGFSPTAPIGDRAYTDTLALLLAAAALVQRGDAVVEWLVYDDGALREVTMRADGEVDLRIPHRQWQGDKTMRISTPTRCLRVRVAARSQATEEAEFSLLGLRGELLMYLDLRSGAVLRISGQEPRIGALTINATRVYLVQ